MITFGNKNIIEDDEGNIIIKDSVIAEQLKDEILPENIIINLKDK